MEQDEKMKDKGLHNVGLQDFFQALEIMDKRITL